jgi:CheY-like chemotaxis protein
MAADTLPEICSVLLVEDDVDTRDVTARLLRAAGCMVKSAATVGEALLVLDEWQPTHILLDLTLPDGGGSVILNSVRRRQLPVRVAIVTAASPESKALRDANRWKPDAIFYKPIVFPEIEAWLENA